MILFSPLLAYIYTVVLKLPKTINHLYVLLALIIGFIFIIKKSVISREKIHFPKYLWFLLCYATYRLGWMLIAGVELHPLTFIYYAILYYSTLLIILLIYNTHITDEFINKIIFIIKITIILAAIASIVQVFDRSFLHNQHRFDSLGDARKFLSLSMYQLRRPSIFSFNDPNELGLSYLPLVSVLIGFLLFKKNKLTILWTFLVGITAILTNGRYIMISFLILTIQYFVFTRKKFSGILKYVVWAFVIGLIIHFLLHYLGYDYSEWYYQRLFAEGHITEGTRYKAFINFARFFPQHIFIGTGVKLTDEIAVASRSFGSSHIHVGYLSHLVSYGLIGSFFLFGFWFLLARKLYQAARKTNYWGSFFAFLLFFWTQATFTNYSIFFSGLILALVFDKYFQDQYVLPQTEMKMRVAEV